MDDTRPFDRQEAERFSALGDQPAVTIDLAQASAAARANALSDRSQAIVIGIDLAGHLPEVDMACFDVLFTASGVAPGPWVSAGPDRIEAAAAGLLTAIAAQPIAAATLCRVLKIGEGLGFADALSLESFAYSTLLGGAEFRAWMAGQPPREPPPAEALVDYARDGDQVTLTLASPQTRNATSAALRDALCEALRTVLEDLTNPTVILRGAGDCFSTGGHLGEFGQAGDLAMAHVVRTLRSPAALLHALGDRATVVLHGACIGGGVEIAAGAARRIARNRTFLQLPEVSMGLIPGAGGTVTVPRAIGRHRAAFMALSGRRISTSLALQWGLVHEVVP